MMVLPPHGSHALQPLDVGCFGPFKGCYYNKCNLVMAQHRGRVITRYDMAELSGKAHLKTLTPINIVSVFRKSGVVPLDRSQIPPEIVRPSETFKKNKPQPATTLKLTQKMTETGPINEPETKQKTTTTRKFNDQNLAEEQ